MDQQPAAEHTVTDTGSAFFARGMDALWALKTAQSFTERITDDEQGVLGAMALSLRADCTRRRVACLITNPQGRVIGAGRNGAPPGRPGCLTAGACPRGRTSYTEVAPGSSYASGQSGACIANHAETNGILFSDPTARLGGTIYITDPPCSDCSRTLAGSGLARAVWPQRDESGAWVIRSIDIATAPIGGYLTAASPIAPPSACATPSSPGSQARHHADCSPDACLTPTPARCPQAV